jgi:hypothetical protein
MTRSGKIWLKFLWSFLLISSSLDAQNLYDASHSIQYASHLYSTKQYLYSAIEYKRLAAFFPSNDTIKYKVMHSYRLAGYPDSGRVFGYSILPFSKSNELVLTEMEKALILTHRYMAADSVISNAPDSLHYKKYFFYNSVLSGNWNAARYRINHDPEALGNNAEAWKDLLHRQEHPRHKSPGVALVMSTVIPGSGKMYSGEWKDGLFALLLVGSSAYESYVGFHARGTRSVLGWVFGGLTIGFYGGNIYGSYQSAKRFNERQITNIHDEAERLVVSDF